MRRTGLERRWNVARKQAQGERFLRMAGVSDLVAAAGLWEDPNAPGHRRCLAVRAVGLLGEPYPKQLAELADDDESALARAWRRANYDAERRRLAERRIRDEEEAIAKMGALGVGSPTEVIVILQNPSETPDRRESAADVLGGLRCRDAVGPLIEALSEGEQRLSGMCMWAITGIGSRRGARRLIDIVRGNYPLPARQEAIFALWRLQEFRAEQLFIQVSAALDTEEEYTRDMATEALGNTNWRPQTQIAIAERLFDPSVSIRYAALCACSGLSYKRPPTFPEFLRRAVAAKLEDPDKVGDHRVIAKLAAQLLENYTASLP